MAEQVAEDQALLKVHRQTAAAGDVVEQVAEHVAEDVVKPNDTAFFQSYTNIRQFNLRRFFAQSFKPVILIKSNCTALES